MLGVYVVLDGREAVFLVWLVETARNPYCRKLVYGLESLDCRLEVNLLPSRWAESGYLSSLSVSYV